MCAEHLPALRKDQILGEPARKNTAPCIAYAAYKLYQKNKDAVMVISPSDHVILKPGEFSDAMESAVEHARKTGNLMTLGIRPSRPDSGYGYIQFHVGDAKDKSPIRKVKTFTEKPSVDLALKFLQSGDFYWNSGMFIWKVSAIIEAFEKHLPDIAKVFEEHLDAFNTPKEAKAVREIYGQCPNISIDYGIMEHAKNVDVVLGDFGWSDLGTWGSLYEQLAENTDTNVKLGGKVRAYDSSYSIVKVPDGKLAVVQGLSNYIVIDTPDVLLICQKDEEQKIKQFVQDLKQDKENNFL
jgi:mannose-1-phosphate guanylyltransferase